MWSWTRSDIMVQEFQYAWRTLRKNPGFAATAILTLALGIGASTAVFTVVDSVLLQPSSQDGRSLRRRRHSRPQSPNTVQISERGCAQRISSRGCPPRSSAYRIHSRAHAGRRSLRNRPADDAGWRAIPQGEERRRTPFRSCFSAAAPSGGEAIFRFRYHAAIAAGKARPIPRQLMVSHRHRHGPGFAGQRRMV